jgi:phage baseplate assembly protein W
MMATKEPEIWSEISHELITDGQGAVKRVMNVNSVYSSIDNILGTRRGQRVMLPTFASTLGDMLFQPIDSHLSSYMADEIKSVIEAWDDRVYVINVNYSADPDNNAVSLSILFKIRGFENTFTYRKLVT